MRRIIRPFGKFAEELSSIASTQQDTSSLDFPKRSIVLTGGGTAGHVTPNIALLDSLHADGWTTHYIGSANGIEQNMLKALKVPFYAIYSGKLRRYFSWQNIIAPIYIFMGIVQSWLILGRLKADIVFSKGGFVAFPVVVAAWLRNIPVVVHESDLTPGLANRLCFPFAYKICTTFAVTAKYINQPNKVECTGTPIRQSLLQGDKNKGYALCGFDLQKPCLLVTGGSLGSVKINQFIRQSLPKLCENFQVMHLCGKGNLDQSLLNYAGYFQMEYAQDELADLFAMSSIVISRAGSNTLYELLALQKPHILIPLSLKVSRGDQIENARYFANQGISVVVNDDELTTDTLLAAITDLQHNYEAVQERIHALDIKSATPRILAILMNHT